MLLVRLALGFTILAAACQGEYPIAPTACDEWCDATQGLTCGGFYDPAGCVSECEEQNLTGVACRAPFEVVLACFRDTPEAAATHCSDGFEVPLCQDELQALYACLNEAPKG